MIILFYILFVSLLVSIDSKLFSFSSRDLANFLRSGQKINYFAYGSNMKSSVLEEKRKIKVQEWVGPSVLHHHKLVFNVPGLPFIEPSFASIEPFQNHEVHGLLVSIDFQSFMRLSASEGVPLSYQFYPVEVTPYASNTTTLAVTFRAMLSPTRIPSAIEVLPSKAYLNLIFDGARETKLDSLYVHRKSVFILRHLDLCSRKDNSKPIIQPHPDDDKNELSSHGFPLESQFTSKAFSKHINKLTFTIAFALPCAELIQLIRVLVSLNFDFPIKMLDLLLLSFMLGRFESMGVINSERRIKELRNSNSYFFVKEAKPISDTDGLQFL
eukprot:gene3331-6592_t